MDFIGELLINLVLQIIGQLFSELVLDALFKSAAKVVISRVGRVVVGAAVGLSFGLFWGDHLSGGSSWPKLLWVSLAFLAAALVLAIGRAGHQPAPSPWIPSRTKEIWLEIAQPPWHWSAYRLVSFAALNAGIAAGIGLAFEPSHVLR